jgi:hypothetical protein
VSVNMPTAGGGYRTSSSLLPTSPEATPSGCAGAVQMLTLPKLEEALAKAHRSPSLSALLGQPATLGYDSVLIKRTTLRHLAKVPPARRAAILYLIKGRGMNGGGAGRGQRVGVGHDYEMMLLLCYCCC